MSTGALCRFGAANLSRGLRFPWAATSLVNRCVVKRDQTATSRLMETGKNSFSAWTKPSMAMPQRSGVVNISSSTPEFLVEQLKRAEERRKKVHTRAHRADIIFQIIWRTPLLMIFLITLYLQLAILNYIPEEDTFLIV